MVRRLGTISLWCFLLFWLGSASPCDAQQQDQQADTKDTPTGATSAENSGSNKDVPTAAEADPRDFDTTLGRHVFKDFAEDQKAIWTSPFHVKLVDAEWLVPLGGAAAAMFATDTEVSKHLNSSPSRISTSNSLANYGIASLAATGGGMYLWGHLTHNDHMRETGFLAGEAAVDSLAATYALKYTLRRERPLNDNFQGHFWHGGDSFPSEHSSAAWSIASVIAHEYPGPLTSVVAYGLAAGISASRITAQQHFPSDVLVGSALGWFIGQQIYRHHHDPTIGGGEWETYAEKHERDENRPSTSVGSPYVPLDSWIYPALERLIAMGYVTDAFLSLRPWTRRECVRLLDEAEEHQGNSDGTSAEADSVISSLRAELTPDEAGIGEPRLKIESVYARYTNISGEPLRDSYEFGQTVVNDFGRPYAEGNNVVAGVSVDATAGSLVGYARVEYRHAPSMAALPFSARQIIPLVDFLPPTDVPPGTPAAATNQIDLVEGYVGFQAKDWQITFGKQAEWWGPDRSGPMMFSDNAEPITMFRINRTSPFRLPSILGLFGPIRVEVFVGQLSGHHFIDTVETGGVVGSFTTYVHPQPFISGQSFSFKPTPNVEFGFTRTTVFAGEGVPFTPHTLIQSIFSLGNGAPGASDDPGDRRSGFDLTYRLPWVRNWLTFYADGFTDDQITPVAYWDRSSWISGLHLSHIPRLAKLELRAEGVFTDLPIGGNVAHGFFYANTHYLSGYTSNENIIGSWIGRQGQGADGWATYWFTARSKIEVNYRHEKVSKQFIPSGGTLTDVNINTDLLVKRHFSIVGSVQYETWDFPVISAQKKADVRTSIQVTLWPEWLRRDDHQARSEATN